MVVAYFPWYFTRRPVWQPQPWRGRSFIEHTCAHWFAWQRQKSRHQRAGRHRSQGQLADIHDSILACCCQRELHCSVSLTVATLNKFNTKASAVAIEQSPLRRLLLPVCCRNDHDTGQIEFDKERVQRWFSWHQWVIVILKSDVHLDSKNIAEVCRRCKHVATLSRRLSVYARVPMGTTKIFFFLQNEYLVALFVA